MKAEAPTVRQATMDDVPFLARMDYQASLMPSGESVWDHLLAPTGTETPVFAEMMLRERASAWGNAEDFIILEVEGHPAATCSVFRPSGDPRSLGPLNLEKLGDLAERLRWSDEVTAAFRSAYQAVWEGYADVLKAQAETIIESVAVDPHYRRRGLGDALMRAAFDQARRMGAKSIGVMVIIGNDAAQALYEKHFDRYATFYAAYFKDEFPGLIKYRATLNQ